ncbi:MAG: AAA family ATPase [Leptothrix ochracea]|uniref:AAA family ATPase n=1 Tax=Leptothrix ochracea TaxID=735331 RepID=UPI0034E26B95
MHIRRLRVSQVRRFRAPFELNGLDPGLNIISGPNEAGKSTLVRAIRAAFFERSRSSGAEDLRPWGDGSAVPEIELDFAWAGENFRLSKRFLVKKRCALQVGAKTLEEQEAEDHLAQLFGFAFAGKGASKSEHWGIPGLLWVEQGTGQEVQKAAEYAREHVHNALQGQAETAPGFPGSSAHSAASLAATRGDAVLARLRSLRAELLTAAGKPRAAYSEAIEKVQALKAQLVELDAQITQYRQHVDQLAQWRSQHQADEAARPWQAWRTQLEARQRQRQALQNSENQLIDARRRHAQGVQQHSLLKHQLATLGQQDEAGRQRTQHVLDLSRELDDVSVRVVDARLRFNTAQAEAMDARQAVQQAHQRTLLQSRQTQVHDARVHAERSQHDLARAECEQARLIALSVQAEACAITPEVLQELQGLESRQRALSLQQQSLATRLVFALNPGIDVGIDGGLGGLGEVLKDHGERLLLGPTVLDVPGVGRLHISPGGRTDLDKRVRELEQLEDALQRALQRAGLPDVPTAETRMAQHKELQNQRCLAEQALSLVAPQGLEALRQVAAQASARLQSAQAVLNELHLSSSACAATAAPMTLDEAESRQAHAHAELDVARQAQTHVLQQQAALQSRLEDAQRELAAIRVVLEQSGRSEKLSQAQQSLLNTEAEIGALALRIEQEQAQIHQARPDILDQDIERLGRSIENWQRQQQQRREQILVLENTLQQAGAQGLEEARAALAGECERAERRQTELQRRAAALDLLCQKLEGQRSATLARLQAPLQQHLQHYLPLLFPQATLHITEDLVPGALSRQSVAGVLETGDFSALSFGAREQLGLISRFAYADLLRSAGRPTLLILDDALVHCDGLRLSAMKSVICDAATRHQVLLFTCHPELWQDMGVMMRTLGEPVAQDAKTW